MTVDGGVVDDPKRKVWGGEAVAVAVEVPTEVLADAPEAIPLTICYEDESLLVVDKPPGLVVHPASGNWRGTMLNALLHHAPALATLPRAGIVHRLDKDTSGLLVVAKTLTAQTDLVRQLQARTVKREYLAVVHGDIATAGVVDAPIGRDPVARIRMAVVGGGKPARTHYRPLEHLPGCSLIECRLDTGRTHQVRIHLGERGTPLCGERVYDRPLNGLPMPDPSGSSFSVTRPPAPKPCPVT